MPVTDVERTACDCTVQSNQLAHSFKFKEVNLDNICVDVFKVTSLLLSICHVHNALRVHE